MHRIFSLMREWFGALLAQPGAPDPLARMSIRELADLPVTHPACDL